MDDQPALIHEKTKKSWGGDPALAETPVPLTDFLEQVVAPSGLKVTTAPVREKEGEAYGAAVLKIENRGILFRIAKTTPTKTGQFVTLWKRQAVHGNIAPMDISDGFDDAIIATFNENSRGVFIFSKETLQERKIFSSHGKGGKLAFRVYAPWVETKGVQARAAQKWQCDFFLDLTPPMKNSDLSGVEKDNQIQSTLDRFKELLKIGL